MFKVLLGTLLLVNIQYNLWYGQGGYQEYNVLQQQVELQRQTNNSLKTNNNKMEAEIIELKNGLLTVERYARKELGMIKSGEVFYKIVE
ncbi:septum formation initiator family protein [Thiotrichales bacterium HSG1]|nr:septum formation initiator family protein [Thiotrichales bacterium HSG1]